MNILNLCIVASTKTEKYRQRLQDFVLAYGFKNDNNKENTKITFLVEDESKPSFVSTKFEWVNIPNVPVSLRFIYYLLNNWSSYAWTMQVDDDSSTDIDKTIELLNQFYDSNDSMILMGGRNTDLEPVLQDLLKEMQEPNILFDSSNISIFKEIPYFVHAWEPSILSEAAIKKIKKYSKLEKFLSLALRHRPFYTDQSIYLLCKLAKIPIVEATFLCPFDRHEEYSAFNPCGRYSHIHYVKPELPSYQIILQKIKNII